ncbi:hypothetical protein [Streptomyces indicus]|uniref:Uncharacterized protein n=1 Tax=Streptomyces indicus TaxID=417292 RepID=A0A1G9IW88_9ACTN|nr:hypothetical protein [Streptomyces indicus]SDL29104.1 hypothetical protein SAMN05421806_12588 [Streptomyces indicus]
MISESTRDRIAQAVASTAAVDGEIALSVLNYPLPNSRDEAVELAEDVRKDIVRAEWDAAGMRGATYEMRINALNELPVLRAKKRFADLCVAVIDEVDAEDPQLDPVSAYMVAVMSVPKTEIPDAVAMFRAQHLPTGVYDAVVQMADVERGYKRLRPLASVEDQGDREELLAVYAAADKTVSSHAERIGSHLRSLA